MWQRAARAAAQGEAVWDAGVLGLLPEVLSAGSRAPTLLFCRWAAVEGFPLMSPHGITSESVLRNDALYDS